MISSSVGWTVMRVLGLTSGSVWPLSCRRSLGPLETEPSVSSPNSSAHLTCPGEPSPSSPAEGSTRWVSAPLVMPMPPPQRRS